MAGGVAGLDWRKADRLVAVADKKEAVLAKCEVEVFSRVTGFYRPVEDWNKGKKAEFEDRKTFEIVDSSPGIKDDVINVEVQK